ELQGPDAAVHDEGGGGTSTGTGDRLGPGCRCHLTSLLVGSCVAEVSPHKQDDRRAIEYDPAPEEMRSLAWPALGPRRRLTMAPTSLPPRIGPCSALSRSFILGPRRPRGRRSRL